MRPFISGILLVTLAANVAAQSSHRPRLAFGIHLPLGGSPHNAICDGSEMASMHSRRSLGTVLFFGGLATILISPELVSGGSAGTAVNVATAGAIASSVGVYLRYNSAPSDEFWQNTISQVKVGESRAEEVKQCFGSPNGTSSSNSEATWTYSASKVGFLGFGGSARSLSITMKDGVVTKVQKSEFGF